MRVLICGGGDVALLLAKRMSREGNDVVIVEADAKRCEYLEEALDATIVRGSAASSRTLHRAGLTQADMLIAVTNSDDVNFLACLIAQNERAAKIRIARMRTPEVAYWRHMAENLGLEIDLIIHPESEVAERILRVLPTPGVSDIFDFANGSVRLFGLTIQPDSWVAGKSLRQLDEAGPPRNSIIAMIFRNQQVIIPRGSDTLEVGDHVYVCCNRDEVDEAMRFMGLPGRTDLESVFILGGRQISIQIAQELERRGVQVKLFEQNLERCNRLTEMLDKTLIVNADGTEESILLDENIKGVSAFLSLTSDDEDNLIASLLARKLGANKVVTLLNRLNYLSMAQRLGINTSISPRTVAVDQILQFVRKGRVLSVTTFREEEAEALELLAMEDSRYVGKRLMDLKFPDGTIVGAIAKPTGEVIVPRGQSTIEAGDRVIFFALETAVPKLEQAFFKDRSGGRERR
jgi:trk system potassium uptake protein TrkA